jgi:HEPN domain-containing protein
LSEDDTFLLGRRWLAYAEEDLEAAQKLLSSSGSPRHACFLAQQAAEKALKAVLVFEQLGVPRTHDLEGIRSLIPERWAVKSSRAELEVLSQWSTASRYPELSVVATEEDAVTAIEQARLVVDAVRSDLAQR